MCFGALVLCCWLGRVFTFTDVLEEVRSLWFWPHQTSAGPGNPVVSCPRATVFVLSDCVLKRRV